MGNLRLPLIQQQQQQHQQSSLSPKFYGLLIDPQQISKGRPYVFLSTILFYSILFEVILTSLLDMSFSYH